MNGDLGVTGNYTTTNGNIATVNGTVSGNAVEAGAGGVSSLGVITGNNGLRIWNGDTILQNTTVNGTLGVTGTMTTSGITNSGTIATDSLTVAGGSTTINSNGLTVGGGTQTFVNASTGTITVNATAPANRQTVLNATNGNVNVGGSFVINNPGSTVSMGGNVVHDVATPVAGTDAANKAYVDATVGSGVSKGYVDAGLSALDSRVNRVEQGVAMAIAMQNPVLTGNDRFGVAMNWGNYAGNDSVGLAAVGIIGQNFFGGGEKVGMTGGFSSSGNQVAGRAGLQFTW